ncbi:hypothetical protein [Flavisolibacter ginsenosidimutans]|uniref:Uncharacterized protein n=1 Tax=Flavisolibacter ginsenosidimutans TaxID=661481 RepID=A0A5B8UM74_9BACT|nr:hypothetical protein [Flavisolibacter ginsenosidimutans]QEC57781.1 hypothetical protein FSB75_18350 [Flavisolibacter ginsenosidimutans]
MKAIKITLSICVSTFLLLASCKKRTEDYFVVPPEQAHFVNSSGNYYITNSSTSSFKIPIGLTAVNNVDRKVTVSVTSPTGAVAGTQYNLPSTTITIPAGKTVDSLTVNGLFAGYAGTRRDTLVFTITSSDVTTAAFNNVYKLVLQKYCPVDITSFAGAYNNMNDNDGSPVYKATVAAISAANQTSATTGYIMVSGLWGVPGSGPIRVNLDWTDPGNFKTDIPTGQPLYVDARYGQAFVRPVGSGTFSSCNNTFTLKYQVYVSAGNFTATTTTMAR